MKKEAFRYTNYVFISIRMLFVNITLKKRAKIDDFCSFLVETGIAERPFCAWIPEGSLRHPAEGSSRFLRRPPEGCPAPSTATVIYYSI